MAVPGNAIITSRPQQSKRCIIEMLRYTRAAVDGISGADCSVCCWKLTTLCAGSVDEMFMGYSAAPERSQARALGEQTYSRRVQMISEHK
jgi:hypothetical protein